MKIITDSKIIDDFLERRIDQVIPNKKELRKRLLSRKRLRLYMGIDPTSPKLHIGHLVGSLVLKQFQDLGHEVILLMGDFTATIGDPSGKDKTRQPLTLEQVHQNMKTYQEQLKNILNFSGENPVVIKQNSSWLKEIKFDEVLQLAMSFTAQQMLERDMFQKRLKEGKPISLHELFYPVMVTKDAIEMGVDLELGGSDQLFNMSVGRSLIKTLNGIDKLAVTFPLLVDDQGKKIGKTEGNSIDVADQPEQLFGQIMSTGDGAIMPFFRLITSIPTDELVDLEKQLKTKPMELKKRLAWEVVKMLHSQETADKSQSYFETTVQQKEAPEDIQTISLSSPQITPMELCRLSGIGKSNSQIKRLILQGGVTLDGTKLSDPNQEITVKDGDVVKLGKLNFRRIMIK